MLSDIHDEPTLEKSADEMRAMPSLASFARGKSLLLEISAMPVVHSIHLREPDNGFRRFLFVSDLAGLGIASISIKGCNL